MNRQTNILLVGGTGRNIGKTTMVEMIIKKFSSLYPITVLKTSMLLPDEGHLHGKHIPVEPDEFILKEEVVENGAKDSQRYLKAGADQSFFLSVGEKALNHAMSRFWNLTDKNNLIIAESNVLHNILTPDVFVMIKGKTVKPQAKRLLLSADEVIPAMDIISFENFVNRLSISNKMWNVRSNI